MKGFAWWIGLLAVQGIAASEIGKGEVYAVIELTFRGPAQKAADAPARDVQFWVRFRHEGGAPEYTVHGFWDGDGQGSVEGDVFKVRFTPTRPGRWRLTEVHSNRGELKGQREGDWIVALASKRRGFWVVDEESAGRRWYRRSDGSRQYIIGNTQYSFLSGRREGGRPTGVPIAEDVTRNAEYFKKLRFSLHGDLYPDPVEKPFLDDAGRPTDRGDASHRPNPRWFRQRADVAVQTAFEHDLIADLILAGPDSEDARATLRAAANGGDPEPWLRYVAARYGSYPNVWFCIANEYDLRKPRFDEEQIAHYGRLLRRHLPYRETPVSVHPNAPTLWAGAFDRTGDWHDHHIIQRKIRTLPVSADVMASVWRSAEDGRPRYRPTVNDELSYQGEGDRHSEEDTIEAHLGAFLGGGYGTTGWKYGNKLGHYFWGAFRPEEHTAADNLKWLREQIDAHIRFWKLEPAAGPFLNLDPEFRAMAWPGEEYVLGTNKARAGLVAELPPGRWVVRRFDVIAKEAVVLAAAAQGRFRFDAPASRAVLFHFRRAAPGADRSPSR